MKSQKILINNKGPEFSVRVKGQCRTQKHHQNCPQQIFIVNVIRSMDFATTKEIRAVLGIKLEASKEETEVRSKLDQVLIA